MIDFDLSSLFTIILDDIMILVVGFMLYTYISSWIHVVHISLLIHTLLI